MNNLTPSTQQTMFATWQQHTYAEFVLKDADAALATMTEDPYVSPFPPGPAGRAGQACMSSMPISFCRRSHRISNSPLCRRPSATTGSSRSS